MRRTLVIVVALVAGACAGLLGIRRSTERRPFEHRKHVLEGVACTRCHVAMAMATDTGPLHIPGTDKCIECHEEPHDRRACEGCHGLPEVRQGAALARKYLRFEHKTHVPRQHGECVRCHVDIRSSDERIRPGMGTCLGCHQHEDQYVARDCESCHVDLPSEGTRPETHLVHDGDWLREHGVRTASAGGLCESCHAESWCASCHGTTMPRPPSQLAFEDPFAASVHGAGFRSRHAEVAQGNPALCTTCHAPEACLDCHEDLGRSSLGPDAPLEDRRSPHRAGWLSPRGGPNEHGPAARRDPALCAGCHIGPGEALCVDCHRVGGTGGNPHPPGYSSRLGERTHPSCRPCHGGGA